MSRWDITDPERIHNAEPPRQTQPKESDIASPTVGRSGSDADAPEKEIRPDARSLDGRNQERDLRREYEIDGHRYSLRTTELQAMADIGRFRAIAVQDLAKFVYARNQSRMNHDLENLRKQGLVERHTLVRAHKPDRKMVTLTAEGQQVAEQMSDVPEGQRFYHGIVKSRELHHDADLYKVYQKAVGEIGKKGGKNIRVRLDFELKESINRAKEAGRHLPRDMRERYLAAVAEEHGLTVEGTSIHLPDVQVEYQTLDGRLERENLELVSRNYREQGIRGKAAAGFTLYARAGDTARIRRALSDTGVMREVFSV